MDIRLSAKHAQDANRLSDVAFRTHIEALCWAVEYRTGGRIATDELRRCTGRADRLSAVRELLDADWWAEQPEGDGWLILRDMPMQKLAGRRSMRSPAGWVDPPAGTAPWVCPAGHPWASAVYRLFGDNLLYVGVGDDPAVRICGHRRDKSWWPEVRYAEIEWYEDRSAAEREESRAIASEAPRENIKGVPSQATSGFATCGGQANGSSKSSKTASNCGVPVVSRVRVYRDRNT